MTQGTVVRTALRVVGVMLVFAAGVTPAAALNVVTVTTTADVVNPADGLVSLREAVTTANTDADDTQIVLAANATYTLCGGSLGTNEDANANGDLDHTDTHVLTVTGNGATIQGQCPTERVIHNAHEDASLVLDGLTVRGGALSSGSGSGIFSEGNLTLANVVVTDNTGSPAVVLGDDGFSNPARTLTITASQIVDNNAGGVRINHNGTGSIAGTNVSKNAGSGIVPNFGSVNVVNSTINENGFNGVGGIDAGFLTVADSIVEHNGGWGLRNTGNTPSGSFLLSVTNTQVRANGSGGVECSFCNELVIEQSRIADNLGPGAAFLTLSTTATATITKSTIENNVSPGSGGGIKLAVEPGSGPITPLATVVASTIVGNEAAAGVGGGLASNGVIVQISRSTITENSAASGGGLHVANADLTLTYATIVRNHSPHVANVFRGVDDFVSFGSVIALGQGGGFDCLPGPTTSLGYNFDGDGNCMFGAGPGDQSAAGDPMMGPLGNYGGPTRTILPVAGGPLQDKIPVSEPLATGLDQRDVPRPQGSASDIGSVEIAPPMVVSDTAEANKNARKRIPVLENDVDPDNVFDPDTLSVVAGPMHGTVSLKRGGELLYKPNKGFTGVDTMIYEVCPRPRTEFGTGCPRALVSVCVGGPCTTR